MKQMSLSERGFERKTKRIRKREFLDEMNLVVPWAELVADKGYASKANRQYLKERGMADLIQHKGARGKPLSPILKKLNTALGGLRFKVEQAFGTMKPKFHSARARYFGKAKVQAQMCWAALGMNLLKAHRKLQKMQSVMSQGAGAPA